MGKTHLVQFRDRFLLFQFCRWQRKLPTEIEINLITDRLTMKFQHRPTIKKDFLSVGISRIVDREKADPDIALDLVVETTIC